MSAQVPGISELIKKAFDLVDADGDITQVIEAFTLGNALEDVGEVVDQLRKSNGQFLLLRRCWASLSTALEVNVNIPSMKW